MHSRYTFGLTAAIILSASPVIAQEQIFNVYGFADAGFEKSEMAQNNFLSFYTYTDLKYSLTHFNLYSDWRPNPNSRALIELGFVNKHEIGGGFPNRRIINDIAGWNQYLASIQPFIPPATFAQLQAMQYTDTTLIMGQRIGTFNLPAIKRAYFEVLVNQYTNFRVGRFITPAGIWNVDHGSPVIVTIKQPYQTAVVPIFPEFQDGILLFGSGFFGYHDYDYQLYVSTGEGGEENALEDVSYLSGGGRVGMQLNLPVKVKLGVSGFSGVVRRTDHYNLASRTFSDTDFTTPDSTLGGARLPDPSKFIKLGIVGDDEYFYQTTVQIQDRKLAMGVDLRMEYRGAFLQSEFNYRINKNELMNDVESTFDGFYVIAGYKHPIKDWLYIMPYVMYEGLGWKDVQNSGSENTFGYLPMEGFDAYIGGVNIGLYGNVYVKLEYSLGTIRRLEAPPAFPAFINRYSDSDLDITTISGQFAIAF